MYMKISKYHGIGNDFLIIPYMGEIDYSSMAKKYCNRKISIGADGFIVVKKDPYEMIFYNEDGSRAPMCGNGIRCFAKYVCDNYGMQENLDVNTLAGLMKIKVVSKNPFMVQVNMGSPIFDNVAIKAKDNESYLNRKINVSDKEFIINSLFMGTIHTVIFVDNLNDVIDKDYGEKICNYPLFKEKTNVNFVEVIDNNNFKMKTYERGVGWTCACGTGACASYVIGKMYNKCGEYVNVHLEYGMLRIEGDNEILMTGPAEKIFETEM